MVTIAELERSPESIASVIEHTNVEPTATEAEIEQLAADATTYGFGAVVVVPYHVPLVAELVDDDIAVVPVIGFPYGLQNTAAKRAELKPLLEYSDEVDMVIDRTAFANGNYEAVVDDIRAVNELAGDRPLKCIIETPELEPEAIKTAAELVEQAGAQVVKTAVGYSGPTDPAAVRAIDTAVSDHMGIKASGGISTFTQAKEMIQAGATRIGASSGVEIMDSITNQS